MCYVNFMRDPAHPAPRTAPRLARRTLFGAALAAPALAMPALAGPRRPDPALPVVMLDPGHGGKDPGAIGVSGTYEKHIAHAAAQELRRQLEAGRRCRVLLTRRADVFIPLAQRVAIAQRAGAALFVSLHADALSDPSVRGASVYTNADTASDAQTAALAARENAADRFGPAMQGLPPDVAKILGSLVRQETRQGSARVARQVVASLRPQVGLLSNPARHAGFAVLKAADIPSILVEMGFMSNQMDEAALRRADHRARVAGALRVAIEGYLAGGNRAVRVSEG
jgi:N-acetylmuramoyl-L-alanine amidase